MMTNKWILVILSALAALLAWASQQNWADLTPEYAAYIAASISVLTTLLHYALPSSTSAVLPKAAGDSTFLTSHVVVPNAKGAVSGTTLRSLAWLIGMGFLLIAISQSLTACAYLDEGIDYITQPKVQAAIGVVETGIAGLECKIAAGSAIAQQVEKAARADAKTKAITGIVAVASAALCPAAGGTLTGNTVAASANTPVVTSVATE